MAIQSDLFGGDVVKVAVERIRYFEPKEGYYLAFSGGKDSVCIKALADMAGVKYDAHLAVTGIDPPELYKFVREHHPDVQWDKPGREHGGFFEAIMKFGFPTRRVRWCCRYMKESGGDGRRIMTGVRAAESTLRSKRKMVETSNKQGNRTWYLHAIFDWTDDDVWNFIKANEIPYCELYDEGLDRLGCIGCPMAREGRRGQFRRWPKYERAWRSAFRRLFGAFKARDHKLIKQWGWQDGDAMFEWWLSDDNGTKYDEEQCTFKFD